MRHGLARVLWLCLVWLCAAPGALVHADPVDPLALEGRWLGTSLSWLRDRSEMLTAEQALASTAWKPVREDIPNFGVNADDYWFRLDLDPDALASERWLLEVPYPILQQLSMIVFRDGVQVAEDNSRPESGGPQRLVPHRHFLFALPQERGTMTVLLRLRSPASVQLPLRLWRENGFVEKEEPELLLAGGYTGIMLAMLLFNLFLARSGGGRRYYLYAGMVGSVMLLQLVLLGFAQRFMPLAAMSWSTTVLPHAVLMAVFFAGAFCDDFLQLERHQEPLRLPYRLVRWCALVMFVFSGFMAPSLAVTIAIMLALIGASMTIMLVVRHYDAEDRAVLYFCMAWLVFLGGTGLITLNKLDLIERNAFTEFLLPIGSVLECILLSLALGERINQERHLKEQALAHALTLERQEADACKEAMRHSEVARKAQEITLRMQRDNNAVLEQKVDERTKALADINQRLEELTRLDPLTGVKNRRFLHQRLREEFQRAHRAGHWLAVVMVDIDHFKRINDQYGHLMGDDCLRAVADCLVRTVDGPGAVITRFGGEEFCIVLPHANATVAARVAERIRRAVEDHVVMARGHVLRVTASIGWFAGIPDVAQSPEEFMERADISLYAAKHDGRNCVRGGQA